MINPISFNTVNSISFKGFLNRTAKIEHQLPSSNSSDLTTPNAIYSRSEIQNDRLLIDNLFIKKSGKVTQAQYDAVKSNYPATITRAKDFTDKMLKHFFVYTTPEKTAKLVSSLESVFDKDTKLISIGTSPAFFTEPMSALGYDVTFVPISNAKMLKSFSDIHDYFEYYPNFKKVGDYMKYKGITKENLKDKKVALLDFGCSGRTMHLVRRLVNEYCGVLKENISLCNIRDLIFNAYDRSITNFISPPPFSYDEMIKDIFFEKVDIASNVPHFSVFSDKSNKKEGHISSKHLSNIELFNQFDNYSKMTARAYQLCVLDELNKMKSSCINSGQTSLQSAD